MKTLILSTSFSVLVPLFIVFAIYMFFRGHDQPGGGFIAGLIASIPFMIYCITFGVEETKRRYRLNQLVIATIGLLIATLSGVFSLLLHRPFLSSLWTESGIPFIAKFGTPLMFDIGVFMVVFGMILQVTFLFTNDIERDDP